jgi:anti-anti-sigma factor
VVAEFVTSADGGERRTLSVSGEVDIATVERFLTQARECLDGSVDVCEIDLGGVTFIDSSGLGALVRIRAAAHDLGKQVALTNVPAPVGRLFDVTGLTEIFGISSDD